MASESNDLTRRDFAKAAVAAAVAPALAACASPALETAPSPTIGPTAAAQTPPAARQEPTPLARALMDAVRVQYGDRMTEEEMAKVQRSISGVLSTAERLRRHPLPIAAEPAFVYRVPGGAA